MDDIDDADDPRSDSEAPPRVAIIEDDDLLSTSIPEPLPELWTSTLEGRYGELPDPEPSQFHGPKLQQPINDPSKTTLSPRWWFSQWWTKDMTTLCMRQTNLYAAQCEASRDSSSRPWTSISAREVEKFLGVLLALGLGSSSSPTCAWNGTYFTDTVKAAMGLIRFQQILRYLHCADNSKDSGEDDLFKVRDLLSMLNRNCQRMWTPSCILAIDEMDIGFRGKHKHKQRITFKKTGDGFLVFALCDSAGYVFAFFVKFDTQWCRNIEGLCASHSVVLALVDILLEHNPLYKYGELYADNFYSSYELAEALFRRNIFYCCTARKGRVPRTLSLPDDAPVNSFVQLHRQNTTVVRWRVKPSKDVLMITTAHRPVTATTKTKRRARFNDASQTYEYVYEQEFTLNCANDYNMNMNLVDIADQIRGYFTTRRRTRKWWHRFFFFCLDTAACNSYVAYKTYWEAENEGKENEDKRKVLTHRQFNHRLAEEYNSGSRKRQRSLSMTSRSASMAKVWKARRLSIPDVHPEVKRYLTVHRLKHLDHYPGGGRQQRKCGYCIKDRNSSKTTYICTGCDTGFHPECFFHYHTGGEE
tara:strand:+ start:236 stop:1993 length:1758 start_codon:yes stop_codon:yes gene_type:complete